MSPPGQMRWRVCGGCGMHGLDACAHKCGPVQMGRHHGQSMAQAASAAEFWRRQEEIAERLGREVARGAQAALQEQQAGHEADVKEAARSQAQQLAARFAEELTAERKERHQALSEVCCRCGCLPAGAVAAGRRRCG